MNDFAEFSNLAALVDVMCLWHDAENGPFPASVYCGADPSKPCAVALDDSFSGAKEAQGATLQRLGKQCGFPIAFNIQANRKYIARRLEDLPWWTAAFRDPLTASPGGGRLHVPPRRYILGARSSENSQAIWNALRTCQAPGLAVRPVPEQGSEFHCPYLHFWEVTAGLPAPASGNERPVVSPPPLSILQLADHVWWELVDSQGMGNSALFFEWPFEPVLGGDALDALHMLAKDNDVILLSRHAPRHLRLERFRDDRAFRELAEMFPLAATRIAMPKLPADEDAHFQSTHGSFPIELSLVPKQGRRALDDRDRELDLAINSLILRRSRRRELDIRMGRLGQTIAGPVVVEPSEMEKMPEELKESFREWVRRHGKAIREVFIEPLMVYLAPPGVTPDPIRDLLIDFAGQHEDLKALRHLRLSVDEARIWRHPSDPPVEAHLVTTRLALGDRGNPHDPVSEEMFNRLRTLGMRLLEYRPRDGRHVQFEVSAEWAVDAFDLRLFVPYGQHLDFYPPIPPSEIAADNLADALLRPEHDGDGSPPDWRAQDWCGLVLPGERAEGRVRCMRLRRDDFLPLSKAFSWDCQCDAVPLHPRLPVRLPEVADAVALALDANFEERARDEIEKVVAERVEQVDATRAELEQMALRAQGQRAEAAKQQIEIARVQTILDDLVTARKETRDALDGLRRDIGSLRTNSEGASQAVVKLADVVKKLSDVETQIAALVK